MPRVSCATCTTCIHIHVPQCHTMSCNVLSLESFTCPSQPRRICRDGPVDSFQQSWSLYFRRRPQTAREGEIHSTLVTSGHHWSPVCSAQHIQQCLNCTFQKWFESSSEPFLLTFGYLRFHSVFLFILPPAICDLSTCHRLHLGSPVRFKTLWERTAAVGLDHFGSTVATCI